MVRFGRNHPVLILERERVNDIAGSWAIDANRPRVGLTTTRKHLPTPYALCRLINVATLRKGKGELERRRVEIAGCTKQGLKRVKV